MTVVAPAATSRPSRAKFFCDASSRWIEVFSPAFSKGAQPLIVSGLALGMRIGILGGFCVGKLGGVGVRQCCSRHQNGPGCDWPKPKTEHVPVHPTVTTGKQSKNRIFATIRASRARLGPADDVSGSDVPPRWMKFGQ